MINSPRLEPKGQMCECKVCVQPLQRFLTCCISHTHDNLFSEPSVNLLLTNCNQNMFLFYSETESSIYTFWPAGVAMTHYCILLVARLTQWQPAEPFFYFALFSIIFCDRNLKYKISVKISDIPC